MKDRMTTAKKRLFDFFDAGTFVELGAYIRRPSSEDYEGVVCGYGAVEGRLVFAFAQDADAMKGAVDGLHAKKIAMLYEKAIAVGAPVVGVLDSAGALVFEGAAALAGYGVLLSAVAHAAGVVPQIAVIHGVCTGSMAAVAELFDFIVLEKTGTLSLQCEDGKKTGASLMAEDVADADRSVRRLLSYLPDSSATHADHAEATDDPNRLLSLADRTTARDALEASVDVGSFLELMGEAAPDTRVGLCRMGGVATAVIAADGTLDGVGVEKMLTVTRLADAFGMPLVTFLNCEGLASGEGLQTARLLSRLALCQSESASARVTAIVGAAIGAGFIFGGARSLGADTVLALPCAEIAALTAETAVAFLYNDRITPETSREALEQQWRADEATAERAAAVGEVDDIIAPAELRARIIAALYMLEGKNALL